MEHDSEGPELCEPAAKAFSILLMRAHGVETARSTAAGDLKGKDLANCTAACQQWQSTPPSGRMLHAHVSPAGAIMACIE